MIWQKNMDRAIKECDKNTIEMLALLPPKVSAVMLIEMGKKLCEDDEWRKLSQKMKPTLKEKLQNGISHLYGGMSKMRSRMDSENEAS